MDDQRDDREGSGGMTPEEAIQNSFGANPQQPEFRYHEYGLQLRNEGNDLILTVLCGGIGEFDVQFALNSSERDAYEKTGDGYLQKLAADVRHSPRLFAARERRR